MLDQRLPGRNDGPGGDGLLDSAADSVFVNLSVQTVGIDKVSIGIYCGRRGFTQWYISSGRRLDGPEDGAVRRIECDKMAVYECDKEEVPSSNRRNDAAQVDRRGEAVGCKRR